MVASPVDALVAMVSALGATHVSVPMCPVAFDAQNGAEVAWDHAAELQRWRAEMSDGAKVDAVVVAVWPHVLAPSPLLGMSTSEFARRTEWPFAAWIAALGVAVNRCADGGSIVAVVERPSPIDSAGWAPESGIADAVEALIRSLARSEGHRDVHANAVTTPSRLAPSHPIAPFSPLAGFPGRIDVEVTRAVEMMLGPGTAGITGTVVHADCGRSWR